VSSAPAERDGKGDITIGVTQLRAELTRLVRQLD